MSYDLAGMAPTYAQHPCLRDSVLGLKLPTFSISGFVGVNIMQSWIIPALVLTCLFQASSAIASTQSETRIAFVIGNQNYISATPLANPVNDANLMMRVLRTANFDIISRIDATAAEVKDGLSEFLTQLAADKNSVGLVYYAGHGVQVDGENYLVPVDASGESTSDMIPLAPIIKDLAAHGNVTNIIILDACRNNPFATRSLTRSSSLKISRGLAKVETTFPGMFIAYATSPGEIASDGSGNNSPYTQALAEFMQQPGASLESMFKQVRRKVLSVTQSTQRPWESSSLTDEFYFRGSEQLAESKKRADNCLTQPGPYSVTGVKANDALFVREGPGTQYGIMFSIRPDATGITQEECSGDWCRIRYECSSGWAASRYLAMSEGSAVESFSARSDVVSQGLFAVANVRAGDRLNVRSAPNARAELRGTIPPNADAVEVHECNGKDRLEERWCHVSFADVQGWASARFLISNEDEESHPR